MKTIIIDPGHGMSNRKSGVYDSGATSNGATEAGIVMDWANELRSILLARGVSVVRTRVDAKDPCPISARARIAKKYNGAIMLSIHCNASDGAANGTETFYRGSSNKPMAEKINAIACAGLETKNRGAKTEGQSQHSSLAVMGFQPCFLLELGFIDNSSDRAKMLDPERRKATCTALADLLVM